MFKRRKEKERQKKYLILGGIYLAVIVLVLYFSWWYVTYQDYKMETPVLQNTISAITTEEIEHYLMENPTSILYFCIASDKECRSFEQDFKIEILKNEWQDRMTYVDLTSIDDKMGYLNQLIKNYNSSITVSQTPVFIAFEDGMIKEIASGNETNKLTVEKASHFIEKNGAEYE